MKCPFCGYDDSKVLDTRPTDEGYVSVPPVDLSCEILDLLSSGLPHSEICGSIRMCQSPQLIAAYHVLLRLQEPRHPPSALITFRLEPCINLRRYNSQLSYTT